MAGRRCSKTVQTASASSVLYNSLKFVHWFIAFKVEKGELSLGNIAHILLVGLARTYVGMCQWH